MLNIRGMCWTWRFNGISNVQIGLIDFGLNNWFREGLFWIEIVQESFVVEKSKLGYNRHLLAKLSQRIVCDICSLDKYVSKLNGVHSKECVENGSLSRACPSTNSYFFSLLDLKTYIFESKLHFRWFFCEFISFALIISYVNVFKFYWNLAVCVIFSVCLVTQIVGLVSLFNKILVIR